jgi:hypothetical protein
MVALSAHADSAAVIAKTKTKILFMETDKTRLL